MNPGVFKDSLDCKLCRGRVSPYPFNQCNPRAYSRLIVHSNIDQILLKCMKEGLGNWWGFGLLLIHSIDNWKLKLQAVPTCILFFQLVFFYRKFLTVYCYKKFISHKGLWRHLKSLQIIWGSWQRVLSLIRLLIFPMLTQCMELKWVRHSFF